MATITNFQVVQQTAIALSLALLDIQNTVQQVSPQDPLASCYTIFGGVITHLRDQVVKDAADTAEFVINNIFTEVLDPENNTIHKQTIIERFRNANAFRNKVQSAQSLLQDVRDLGALFATSTQLLGQVNANSTSIMNRVNTIITGVQSIVAFYEKIGFVCIDLKDDLNVGNDIIQKIQEETKWLAVVSADYRSFHPDV